jgi:hypothetical protein
MNYIKHLAGFFDRVAGDARLNPTHVSMYVSMFQLWNANRFQNPISIARSELMLISKISGKTTYHKCLKELSEFGYIRYDPSYNPMKGSLVYLFSFEREGVKRKPGNRTGIGTGDGQVEDSSRIRIGTGAGQVPGPFINSINFSKQENIVNGEQQNSDGDGNGEGYGDGDGEGLPSLGEAQRGDGYGNGNGALQRKKKNTPDSLEEVIEYFAARGHAVQEAERYYNHFCSNGWLVGGKAPMKDWKAAARNWMLNIKTYNNGPKPSLHPGNLHTTTDKNYSEPL